MYASCKAWVSSCAICQKYGPAQVHAKLNPLVTDMPFQIVAVDFVGPLPVDGQGNKYIFTMEDVHTRYAEFNAVANSDAQTAVDCIKQKWFARWGVPLVLLSDAGQVFRSKKWLSLCQELSITSISAPPYFQRANGANERLTQSIIQLLRKEMIVTGRHWSGHLEHVSQVYRNLPHATMGCSPNQALFGVALRLPGQPAASTHLQIHPHEIHKVQHTPQTAHSAMTAHQERHWDILLRTNARRSLDYLRHARAYRPLQVRVGDLVYVLDNSLQQHKTAKFAPAWLGPGKVVAQRRPSIFDVYTPDRGVLRRVHIDRMKRHVPRV